MKILITRLSALGDAGLTLPLFFRLRAFFPEAKIGWIIEERNAGLLASVPGLDCVHLLRRKDKNARGFWRLSREIKKENYDVALDAQGLTKSAVLPWLAGIRRRVGFRRYPLEARELAPLLNNELVSPPADTTHIAQRANWLAKPLGVPADFQAPVTLIPPPEAARIIGDWRKTIVAGHPLLMVGIGSSWETKVWPPEYVAKLLAHGIRLGWQPVVIWGPSEADKIGVWREILGTGVVFSPATENIARLIALLDHADAYIGPDSASLHLAWLLGKPTFSWFGPSSAPRGAPPDLDGSGKHCHIIAHPPNRRRHGEMMWRLKPEIVLPKFTEWLVGCKTLRQRIMTQNKIVRNIPNHFAMKQDFPRTSPCPGVEDIPIFMAFNDTYAPHASVAMASILVNSEAPLHFFILHQDISLETRRKIMELQRLRHFGVDFIEINAAMFHGLPTVSHITIECYFRLMIPWLNPAINKALFMDSDIVVLDDIKGIWDFDIKNVYAAVVEDINPGGLKDIKKYEHAFGKGHRYFNAGMMLLNLKNIRADFTPGKFMNIADRMKNVFKYADQDILNSAFARKLKYLPIKWNVTGGFLQRLCAPFSERKHEITGALRNPSLVHFTGAGKPWIFPFGTSSNPFACCYFYYLEKTGYSNTKPGFLFTCLKMTIGEFRHAWRHPLFLIKPAFWRAFFLRHAVDRKLKS